MKYRLNCLQCICVLLAFFFASACDNAGSADEFPIYVVEVSGESFRVQITEPDMIRASDSLLANDIPKIVHGYIRAGDGGINAPYKWHLDPDRITFPDLTIELCDGRPGPIEEDLDYWINTVGVYCPWGAQITGKE